MPRYEFRCQDCATLADDPVAGPGVAAGRFPVFEVTRPMSAASDPASCPAGHRNTMKLLSTVAMTGTASAAGGAGRPAGGGCCGGACGCG